MDTFCHYNVHDPQCRNYQENLLSLYFIVVFFEISLKVKK